MKNIKLKAANLGKADAASDISLVNQFSKAEFQPEKVYCFSMIICDNDVDRDTERFTDECLDKMAPLFVGKTVISDHWPSADNQKARIYRTEVVSMGGKNYLGQELKGIRADAYIPRNDSSQKLIDAIEGGIAKEVSIACKTTKRSCSLCDSPMRVDPFTWTTRCKNDHILGKKYDEGQCVGELSNPTEAYEVSFCAVPSQRRAGVVKASTDAEVLSAIEVLKQADVTQYAELFLSIAPKVKAAALDEEERIEREKIAKQSQSYLEERK